MSLETPTGTQPASRHQRRRWRDGAGPILVVALLLVVAVGVGAFQWGAGRARTVTAPTVTASSGAGTLAATATSAPTTTAPAKPRVLTLITENVGTEANPNRVYRAPGQPGTHHPRLVVRPGERIQIRVDNRDDVVHTWTFPEKPLNVDAYEESPLKPPLARITTSKPFLAPTKPGTYNFYCRYRKKGMDGELVVRGPPVRG